MGPPGVLSNRLMNRDELRAIRKCALDLDLADHVGDTFHYGISRENRRAEAHDFGHRPAVANHFENFRGNQGDRFRMIQFESARPSLPRKFSGGKNQELVDFPWSQMHGDSDLCLTSCAK